MGKFFVVLALACSIGVALGQYSPVAVLYSNTNCGGAFITVPTNNYVENLAQLGFDNHARSARLRGT